MLDIENCHKDNLYKTFISNGKARKKTQGIFL